MSSLNSRAQPSLSTFLKLKTHTHTDEPRQPASRPASQPTLTLSPPPPPPTPNTHTQIENFDFSADQRKTVITYSESSTADCRDRPWIHLENGMLRVALRFVPGKSKHTSICHVCMQTWESFLHVSPTRKVSHSVFFGTEATHGVCQPDRLLLCLSPCVTGSRPSLSGLHSFCLPFSVIICYQIL